MSEQRSFIHWMSAQGHRPQGRALLLGSEHYPDLTGRVLFYQIGRGVIVAVEVTGLPLSPDGTPDRVFGFHIHGGGRCSGNETDPFADALTHYNPQNRPHPYHAGDLPPLFGNAGRAFQVFLTDRFSVREVIGKTVILHAAPDDFTSQPAGHAGEKIACGEILPCPGCLSAQHG